MQIDPDDLALTGRERSNNGARMTFCWCPPGTFHMGSVPDVAEKSEHARPVTVTIRRGFWMGKFEVTQAQWKAVMGAAPSDFKGPNRPVEQVSIGIDPSGSFLCRRSRT